MRIVVIGAPETAARLAQQLELRHLDRLAQIDCDEFVLDGTALTADHAAELDRILHARACGVDAVLVARGTESELLEHYLGRVIELDDADPVGSALVGLRETLLAA